MLKLTRADEINGDIFFRIYYNDNCIKVFYAQGECEAPGEEHRARVFFRECQERISNGYPKESIIIQDEI
jgi:hypothetical protein